MVRAEVNVAVEGELDEVVLRRLLESVGIEAVRVHGKRGKPFLQENVSRYNHAAAHAGWVVLVDLDESFECAPQLVESWMPKAHRHPSLQLRVAVRAVEAWLLADEEAISRFLRLPPNKVPRRPEEISDPKGALIEAVRRYGTTPLKKDMVPPEGSTRRQGRAMSTAWPNSP